VQEAAVVVDQAVEHPHGQTFSDWITAGSFLFCSLHESVMHLF